MMGNKYGDYGGDYGGGMMNNHMVRMDGDGGRGQAKVLKREKLSEHELNWDAGQYVFQAKKKNLAVSINK